MKTKEKMKAIVYTEYGPPEVLQLKEVEKPTPKEDEVLVKVHAASINYVYWHVLRGKSFLLRILNGIQKPKHKILGDDVAGRIETIGVNVKHFMPGDEVFGISANDAFAEYSCVKEKYSGLKPANISFEEAAAVPYAGITALLGLRDFGQIQSGQKVLINGASGGVGTFAVQIAKSYGAEVTGVCSTRKLDMVRSIGADHVIDYTKEDFTKCGATYDFILDVISRSSFSGSIRSLKQNGHFLIANPGLSQMVRGKLTSMRDSLLGWKGGKQVIFGTVHPKTEDLIFLKELIEAGELKAVIDRCYPLEQIAEAHRYVETGQKKGNVVITVA